MVQSTDEPKMFGVSGEITVIQEIIAFHKTMKKIFFEEVKVSVASNMLTFLWNYSRNLSEVRGVSLQACASKLA